MTASSPLEHFPHEVILASAGTGKTYQLTNRYIALLHGDVQPEEILATTFTRKAAGEILDRVMRRLADAALDEEKCSQLAGDIAAADLTQKRCLAMLVSLARRLHRVNVCTLDSFFMRLARVLGLELGIAPGWEILDELADHRLRIDAAGSMLHRQETDALAALMRLINDGQYRRAVFEQIMSVVRDLYGVFLTSEEAAWGDIQVPPGLPQPQLAKTIDMLAALPLPTNANGKPSINWNRANEKAVAFAQSGDWLGMLGQGIAKSLLAGKDKFSAKDIPAAVREVYQPLIAHGGSVLLARLVRRTQAVRSLIGAFASEYDDAKSARRAFTFDDITRTLARAAAGQGATDLPDIFARLDSTISHVLLDEFQDTSLSQWEVLRPIAEASLNSPPGPAGSFFAVGDVKQAIYGWRGGQSQLLASLPKTYKQLSARRLVRNYRSAPAMIEMVNTVFADLVNNPALQDHREAAAAWAEGFTPHETARTELVGYAQLRTAPDADEDTDAAVLRCAARQVKEIVDSAPACSVGVLFRRRKHIARLIYELRRPDIDIRASQESGNPLTDSPAVSAALSLLVLADHPGHTAAGFHVAASPLGKAVGLAPGADAFASGARHRHNASGARAARNAATRTPGFATARARPSRRGSRNRVSSSRGRRGTTSGSCRSRSAVSPG